MKIGVVTPVVAPLTIRDDPELISLWKVVVYQWAVNPNLITTQEVYDSEFLTKFVIITANGDAENWSVYGEDQFDDTNSVISLSSQF